LRSIAGTLDEQVNENFNFKVAQSLMNDQMAWMQDSFKRLHHSVETLDKRNLEDLQRKLQLLQEQNEDLVD
jgi:hypothetical protein